MKTLSSDQIAALLKWMRGDAAEKAAELRAAGWVEDERGLWSLGAHRRLHLLDAWEVAKTDNPCDKEAGEEDMDETKKEPTTAEAFEVLRKELRHHGLPDDGPTLGTLALLERRMWALGAAIRDAPHGPGCAWIRNPNRFCDCWKAAALSDTPPVFTLEEVEQFVEGVGGVINAGPPSSNGERFYLSERENKLFNEGAREVVKRLAALRGGGR